jgi:serine/threonine protein kinase
MPLHGCTPFDDENGPAMFTPLMKSSLHQCIDFKRRENALRIETSTQKHIVLLGIASRMAFMHENRVIHRDLKPANVLLDDACEPHVADFGLSKFVGRGDVLAVDPLRDMPVCGA